MSLSRVYCWPVLAGGDLLASDSKYSYVEYVRRWKATSVPDRSAKHLNLLPDFDEDRIQIDLDLSRSESLLESKLRIPVESRNGFLGMVRRILTAFCFRNPDIGYVQGHHCIVSTIAYALEYDEEKVFWTFCGLCENVLGREYYRKDPKLQGFRNSTQLLVGAAEKLLSRRKVELIRKSGEMDSFILLVSLNWLLTLFCDEAGICLDASLLFLDSLFLSYNGCNARIHADKMQRVMNMVRRNSAKVREKSIFHLKFMLAIIKSIPLLENRKSNKGIDICERGESNACLGRYMKTYYEYLESLNTRKVTSLLDLAYSLPSSAFSFQVRISPTKAIAEPQLEDSPACDCKGLKSEISIQPMTANEAKAMINFTAKMIRKGRHVLTYDTFKYFLSSRFATWKSEDVLCLFSKIDRNCDNMVDLRDALNTLCALCDDPSYKPDELEKIATGIQYELGRLELNGLPKPILSLQGQQCQCSIS